MKPVIYSLLLSFALLAKAQSIFNLSEETYRLTNSIAQLVIDGQYTCTGVLVNNSANDGKPLILTAAHCFTSGNQFESIVVRIGRKKLTLSSNIDALEWESDFGASVLIESVSYDFVLLELNEEIPVEYDPYYAGWGKTPVKNHLSYCFHHPTFDFLKIATDLTGAKIGTFSGDFGVGEPPLKNGFWRISDWEYGTTETGSSGAPLFSQNNRLLGLLSGSGLTAVDTFDYFTRFDLILSEFNEVKQALDPENTLLQVPGASINEIYEHTKVRTYLYTDSTDSNYTLRPGRHFSVEFTELKKGSIKGIYLPVSNYVSDIEGTITCTIYQNGEEIHKEEINVFTLFQFTENYIPFLEPVPFEGNLALEAKFHSIIPGDSLLVPLTQGKHTFPARIDSMQIDRTPAIGLLVEEAVFEIFPQTENSEDEPLIFPNPASDVLFITENVEVISCVGMNGTSYPLPVQPYFNHVKILDLTALNPGVYTLVIKLNSGKLIKKRMILNTKN